MVDSSLTPAAWPRNAPFALFLSHDVDQIHDRELFRILADLNHVRRRVLHGETGDTALALRRVARALLRPKPAEEDFKTVLGIEGRHGFRSTFYLLHDPYWSRHGPRYTFRDRALRLICERVLDAGGELGVHGGYYRFNNAAAYRASRVAVQEAFGVDPIGIRNHYLRFSYPETWRAQAEAGFAYDATYGWPERLGPRDCPPLPFFAPDGGADPASTGVHRALESGNRCLDLLELPLTVMDTTLFRYLRLSGEAALAVAGEVVESVAKQGGLVSLLWHNNFFNEPEYWDWQMVYERLLERLAAQGPWCAPGAEINRWWRARSALTVESVPAPPKSRKWMVRVPHEIRDLCLVLRPAADVGAIQAGQADARIRRVADAVEIHFPRLGAHSSIAVSAATT